MSMRVILWAILLLPVVVNGQSECEVIAANTEKGVYKIQIEGKIHNLVERFIISIAIKQF